MNQPIFERLSVALLTGLAAGAFLLAPLMTAIVLSWNQDQPTWPWQGLLDVGMMTAISSLLLLGGYIAGAPIWTAFHRYGMRSWYNAALTGFVASFVVEYFFITRKVEFNGGVAIGAAIFGMIGLISWLAAWRVAYHSENSI
jgi:hypothetical protein